MVKLTKAQREFCDELAHENPPPSEQWKLRDNWDPMFPLAVIDAMERKGMIETRGDKTRQHGGIAITAERIFTIGSAVIGVLYTADALLSLFGDWGS